MAEVLIDEFLIPYNTFRKTAPGGLLDAEILQEEFTIQFGREIHDPRTGKLLGSRSIGINSEWRREVFSVRDQMLDSGIIRSQKELSAYFAENYPETEITFPTDDEVKDLMIADLLAETQGELVIHAPGKAVRAILEEGFKTQRETGTTGGLLDVAQRDSSEERQFGKNAGEPIYGAIVRDTDRIRGSGSETYGAVQFVLKPEVRNRTTVSFGDSLGGHSPVMSTSPMRLGDTDPKHLLAATTNRTSFDRRSHDAILALVAEKNPEFAMPPRRQIYEKTAPHLNDTIQHPAWSELDHKYVEAQIHGGVSASDIAGVRLARPTPALLQKFEAAGIPVLGTTAPTVLFD